MGTRASSSARGSERHGSSDGESPSDSLRPLESELLPAPEALQATLGAIGLTMAHERGSSDSARTTFLVLTGAQDLHTRTDPRTDPWLKSGETRDQLSSPGDRSDINVDLSGVTIEDNQRNDVTLSHNYVPLEEIGRGGMGVVYRAEQTVLRRNIAVKTAKLGAHDARGVKFIAEALVTAQLEHPNIIPVYDLTTTSDKRVALAMKLVGGTTWRDVLHPDSEGPAKHRDLDYHLDVLLAVANAAAFAHSKHIIHCDIKPSNVLIGEFGEVLLVDWGVALDFRDHKDPYSPAPHKSELCSPCGTPRYMSPELALGQGDKLGPWTDIYLLGAMLYEILTREPPHFGATVIETLWHAAECPEPDFQGRDDIPEGLRAICMTAMQREPEQRYRSVAAFQQAVREYLSNRQSMIIAARASETLARCTRNARRRTVDTGARSKLYSDFAEAVAGFRQALVLWSDNPEALRGVERARIAFARAALEHRDIGLAEAQLRELDTRKVPARDLLVTVQKAEDIRRRALRTHRRLKHALTTTALVIIAGLASAYVIISAQRKHADENRVLAEHRLANIHRLADVKHLLDAERQAETLWPAVPDNAARMDAWLAGARELIARLDSHERYLSVLRQHGRQVEDSGVYRFTTTEEQWEHDTLAELVLGIAALRDHRVHEIEERLAFARTVQARSIDAYRSEWNQAISAIAGSERYGHLQLTPQLGLVPLGPDPRSGLWEFAHLQSGSVPTRSRGKLVHSDDMAIVLVLLPSGRFKMGAVAPSPAHPAGSANVDPLASETEGPIHTIELSPFFIGKYEMTQGQWQRATGSNPSAYPPGVEIGGRTHTPLHPVEQISWQEAATVMARLDLTLPTEAQWEYAARGGTRTVFFTGNDEESLRGALNIADRYCKEHGGPGSWSYVEWLDDGYVVHAPIGQYRPNRFGLYDVVGNVWEWCADRYGAYTLPVEPGTGLRRAPESSPEVFRGGGFRASAVHARSADRYSLYAPEYRGYDVGVRAARPLTR